MKFWDVVTARKLERTWLRSLIVGFELFGLFSITINVLKNQEVQEILSIIARAGIVVFVFWLFGWVIVDWRKNRER